MNKPPAFQWYVKEWLASPTRLMMTRAARSVYFDLLCFCWDNECLLPSDTSTLAKLCGCTMQEWSEVDSSVMAQFFEVKPGFITHRKLLKQWKERKSFRSKLSETASERGKKGAEARWGIAKEPQESHRKIASASASSSASASKRLKPTPSGNGVEISQHERQPHTPRLGLQTSVRKLAKTKTLTPQQEDYAQVSRLITGAMVIREKAKTVGHELSAGDLKEMLKQWAAEKNIPYTTTLIGRALDVADEKSKELAKVAK